MLKLEITNKDGYLYYLIDEKNNEYVLNLEFLDIEKTPETRKCYLYK